jgi:hypothetical protein
MGDKKNRTSKFDVGYWMLSVYHRSGSDRLLSNLAQLT